MHNDKKLGCCVFFYIFILSETSSQIHFLKKIFNDLCPRQSQFLHRIAVLIYNFINNRCLSNILPNAQKIIYWTYIPKVDGVHFLGCTLGDYTKKFLYKIVLSGEIGKIQILFNVLMHEIAHAVVCKKGFSSKSPTTNHNEMFEMCCRNIILDFTPVQNLLWKEIEYKCDLKAEDIISASGAHVVNTCNFHAIT